MKEAKSNEMDLLLRSLASRRGALTMPGDGAGDDGLVGSDHLDADELNSYAEGVAPEAARARYTKHLADCDACRGIVVGLTQAAGEVANYERPELPRGLTFWQKLAVLFSQPVWRYAVPALILTSVIGIGFFALRPRSNNDFVAENQTPVPQPAERQSGAVSKGSPDLQKKPLYDNITPNATPDLTRGSVEGRKGATTTQEEVPPAPIVPKVVPEKDSRAAGEVAIETETKPSDTFQSKAAAPAPPPGTDSSYDKSASLAKERAAKREDQERDEVSRGQQQQDDVHGPNRARNNTSPQYSQQNSLPMNGRGGPSNQVANKKPSEPEVRTVMGRHFTRDGGAWIDTAYESQATIKVTRGSDQYRALVADEPGIRTIAENLDGVVVVVWKGHAYRLQ